MVSEMVMASLPILPPLEMTAVDHQHSTAHMVDNQWHGKAAIIVEEFLVQVLSRWHRCSLHLVVPSLEVAAVGKEMVANSTSFGGQQYFKVPLAHRYAI